MTTEVVVSIAVVFLMTAWGIWRESAEIGALKRRMNALAERMEAQHKDWHGDNWGTWEWEPLSADGKMGRWQWIREVKK